MAIINLTSLGELLSERGNLPKLRTSEYLPNKRGNSPNPQASEYLPNERTKEETCQNNDSWSIKLTRRTTIGAVLLGLLAALCYSPPSLSARVNECAHGGVITTFLAMVTLPWCMTVALLAVVTCILGVHTQLVCVGVIMNEV